MDTTFISVEAFVSIAGCFAYVGEWGVFLFQYLSHGCWYVGNGCWNCLQKTWSNIRDFFKTNTYWNRLCYLRLSAAWILVWIILFVREILLGRNPVQVCRIGGTEGKGFLAEVKDGNGYFIAVLVCFLLSFGLLLTGYMSLLFQDWRRKIFSKTWLVKPMTINQQTIFFALSLILSLLPNAFKNYDWYGAIAGAIVIFWVFLILMAFQPKSEPGFLGAAIAAWLSIICSIIQCFPRNVVEWVVIVTTFAASMGLFYYYLRYTTPRISEEIHISNSVVGGNVICGRYELRRVEGEELIRMRMRQNEPNLPSLFHIATNNTSSILIPIGSFDSSRDFLIGEEWNFLSDYYTFTRVRDEPRVETPSETVGSHVEQTLEIVPTVRSGETSGAQGLDEEELQ